MSEHQPPRPMPRQDLSAFAAPRGVAVSRLAPRRRPAAPPDADSAVPNGQGDSHTPSAPATGSSATQPATVERLDELATAEPAVKPVEPNDKDAAPQTPAPTKPSSRARGSRAASGREEERGASATSATEPRLGGQIIVYLKDGVADRLRATAKQSGRTHLQLIVDAIDATHSELPDLLEAAGYIDRRESSLFGDSVKGLRRRATGERKAQIGVRPPVGILGVIDQVVVDCAAPNRSALIEVALDRHLPAG